MLKRMGVMAGLGVIACGCSRGKANAEDKGKTVFVEPPAAASSESAPSESPKEPGPKKGSSAAIQSAPGDPFAKSQVDIGLTAVREGARLRITIENKTNVALLCGPKNFAIAFASSKKLVQFKDSDTLFPPVKLNPGDARVGLLSLRDVQEDLKDARLVFNHPDCRPAMAPIHSGEPTETVVKP